MALHLIAEEGRGEDDGCHVPGLGDEWKVSGLPKESEAWSEDESVSSTASRKGNMCNDGLHVIGLHGRKRGRSWWSERACWYPSF